jgi:hypothetical protein
MKNHPPVIFGSAHATPESLFVIRPDAAPGLHFDALYCALTRAEGITDALATALADLEEGPTLDQRTMADLVWSLDGLITQAKAILRHAESKEVVR